MTSKKPFDPDAYLASKEQEAPAFDPDAYLAAVGVEPEREKASFGKGLLTGAQEAASFGARGAIAGASEAVGSGLHAFFNQLDGTPLNERVSNAVSAGASAYNPAREQANAEAAQVENDQPTATLLGNVAGTVATLPVALGKGIQGGARIGALAGLGSAASEGETAVGALKSAAIGATGGALLGAAGNKIAASLGPKGLTATAGRQGFRALGPGGKAAKVNLAKGQVEHIGNTLIDKGIISGNPKGYDRIVQEVSEKASEWGDELGKAIDKLDELAVNRGIETHGVDMSKVGSEVLEAVAQDPKLPGSRQFNEQAKAYIQEFLVNNEPRQGIKAAEALKTQVGKRVNWEKNPADFSPQEMLDSALYRALKNQAEETALSLAGIAEKELSASFKNAKSIYGALAEAKKIVSDKAARELANRFISPSDYMTGGIGAAAGWSSGDDIVDSMKRAAIGGMLGLVNKGARQYGPQFTAKGAKGLAGLLKLGSKVTPAGTGKTLNRSILFEGTAPTIRTRAVAEE
jgi:hypothetical protein